MFCAHIPKLDSSASCFIQSRTLASGANASGRHNCNLGEDQQQNSQPLRNAKQANSGPYRSDHDCIISQRNRCVGFLSYQHHSAPCPSNNHGDPHDSDHYGKDASKHGSPHSPTPPSRSSDGFMIPTTPSSPPTFRETFFPMPVPSRRHGRSRRQPPQALGLSARRPSWLGLE